MERQWFAGNVTSKIGRVIYVLYALSIFASQNIIIRAFRYTETLNKTHPRISHQFFLFFRTFYFDTLCEIIQSSPLQRRNVFPLVCLKDWGTLTWHFFFFDIHSAPMPQIHCHLQGNNSSKCYARFEGMSVKLVRFQFRQPSEYIYLE